MTVTQKELGGRLRSARDAVGMTQEEAAARIEVSRPTLAQVEAGNRPASSLELDRLAGLYGRDIRDFLAPQFEEDEALRALFRAEPGFESSADLRDALVAWRNKGRALSNLEVLLELPQRLCTAAAYSVSLPATRWLAIEQGQQVGEEERSRLGLGRAPLPGLADLLESQGVRTAVEELPDNVSGLTLLGREQSPLIVLNSRHPPLRWRFSFAHEYAHVLLDRSRGGVVSRLEDRNEVKEIRANAFAAALLMPADGVRAFVQDLGKGSASRHTAQVYDEEGQAPVRVEGRAAPRSQDLQMYDVIRIAEHFGVSRMAMIYRLRNLRLITQPELETLKAQAEDRHTDEMAGVLGANPRTEPEPSSAFRRRFVGCLLEAYRRSLISRGKLLELGGLIGLSRAELEILEDVGGPSEQEMAGAGGSAA